MINSNIIKRLCCQQGLSLIQVIVSMAILSMLSIGYMQMSQSGLKSSKHVETNMDILTIINEMGNMLGNGSSCKESFKNVHLKESNLNEIKSLILKNNNGDFVHKYKVGNSYGNSNVKVKSYQLSDKDEEVDVDLENSTFLLVTFERSRNLKLPPIVKRIRLSLVIDESHKLKACYASGYGKSMDNLLSMNDSDDLGDGYLCNNIGDLKFDEETNILQVCGSDYIWYNTLMVCPAGAVKTCPSDSSVYQTCSTLGTWSAWTGECHEE